MYSDAISAASVVTNVEALNRLGRPLLRVGLAVAMVVTALGCGSAIAFAMWRSGATGLPMPDLTVGLGPIALAVIPQLFDQWTRSREKEAELAWRNAQGPRPAEVVG